MSALSSLPQLEASVSSVTYVGPDLCISPCPCFRLGNNSEEMSDVFLATTTTTASKKKSAAALPLRGSALFGRVRKSNIHQLSPPTKKHFKEREEMEKKCLVEADTVFVDTAPYPVAASSLSSTKTSARSRLFASSSSEMAATSTAAAFFGTDKAHPLHKVLEASCVVSVAVEALDDESGEASCLRSTQPRRCLVVTSDEEIYSSCIRKERGDTTSELLSGSEKGKIVAFYDISNVTSGARAALRASGGPELNSFGLASERTLTRFTFRNGIAVAVLCQRTEGSGGGTSACRWLLAADFRSGGTVAWAASRLANTRAALISAHGLPTQTEVYDDLAAADEKSVIAVSIDCVAGIITTQTASVGAALHTRESSKSTTLPLRVALDTFTPLPAGAVAVNASPQHFSPASPSSLIIDLNVMALAPIIGDSSLNIMRPSEGYHYMYHVHSLVTHRHFAWQSDFFATSDIPAARSERVAVVSSTCGGRAVAVALRGHAAGVSSKLSSSSDAFHTLIAQLVVPHPLALLSSTLQTKPPALSAVVAVSPRPSPQPLVALAYLWAGQHTVANYPSTLTEVLDVAQVVAVGAACTSITVALAMDCVATSVAAPQSLLMPRETDSLSISLSPLLTHITSTTDARHSSIGEFKILFSKGGTLTSVSVARRTTIQRNPGEESNFLPLSQRRRSIHLQLTHAALSSVAFCDSFLFLEQQHNRKSPSSPSGSPSPSFPSVVAMAREAVSRFMATLPLMKSIIEELAFEQRVKKGTTTETTVRRLSVTDMAEGGTWWENRGRVCSDGSSENSEFSRVPAPAFYFQFMLGSLMAIRRTDELAAIVRGLRPLAQLWAEGTAAEAEAVWPIVRAVVSWQKRLVATEEDSQNQAGFLAPHLDSVFVALFRFYYADLDRLGDTYMDDNEKKKSDTFLKAESFIIDRYTDDFLGSLVAGKASDRHNNEDGPTRHLRHSSFTPYTPLTVFSEDPHEAFLMYVSRFGGRIPFLSFITGLSQSEEREVYGAEMKRGTASRGRGNKTEAEIRDSDTIKAAPLLRTEQRADGTWLIEASSGQANADVLHAAGMLLFASISDLRIGLYLTGLRGDASASTRFVVASADANDTEACVLVDPTPLITTDEEESVGVFDDDHTNIAAQQFQKLLKQTETLQVLCCDVLASSSCASTSHVHQALPTALLCALASERYHAVEPLLELHREGALKIYSMQIKSIMAKRGVGSSMIAGGESKQQKSSVRYAPRSFAEIVASLQAASCSDGAMAGDEVRGASTSIPITAEELLMLCQFAASATPSVLFEVLLSFVPTPALSSRTGRSTRTSTTMGGSTGSLAGAVSFAMVLSHGLSAAAEDSFVSGGRRQVERKSSPKNRTNEEEGRTFSSSSAASLSISYGFDRLVRLCTPSKSLLNGAMEATSLPPLIDSIVLAIAATVVVHRYVEFVLGAMNNYCAAVQKVHLARDEGARMAEAHQHVREVTGRLEEALDRSLALTSYCSKLIHKPIVEAAAAGDLITATGRKSDTMEGDNPQHILGRYHSEVYLPTMCRVVMEKVRSNQSAPPAAVAAAGHVDLVERVDCRPDSIISDTALVDYHALWSVQQQLARVKAIKQSLAAIATALASEKRRKDHQAIVVGGSINENVVDRVDDQVHTLIDVFELLMSSSAQPMIPVEEILSLLLTSSRLLLSQLVTDACGPSKTSVAGCNDNDCGWPLLLRSFFVQANHGSVIKKSTFRHCGILLGAALIACKILAFANVERATSNVTVMREFHHLSAAFADLVVHAGGAKDGKEREKKSVLQSEVAMVFPTSVGDRRVSGDRMGSTANDASLEPSSEEVEALYSEARVASRNWVERLNGIVKTFGDTYTVQSISSPHTSSSISSRGGDEEKGLPISNRTLLTTVGGSDATVADFSCSVASLTNRAVPWRNDHALESRRFLICTSWWRLMPLSVVAWAIALKVLSALRDLSERGPNNLPTADMLVPSVLEVPSIFGLSPQRNSGRQSSTLDAPLFSLVCSLVPPSRGFARTDAPRANTLAASTIPRNSVTFSDPPMQLANTPEPLRRSALLHDSDKERGGVRESALSLPSVCVSASTPSHSPYQNRILGGTLAVDESAVIHGTPQKTPQRWLSNEGDSVGRQGGGYNSRSVNALTSSGTVGMSSGSELIESELFPARSIAWWEDEMGSPKCEDVTETTMTTVTTRESGDTISAARRLMLETYPSGMEVDRMMLAREGFDLLQTFSDGRERVCRHGRHRDRPSYKSKCRKQKERDRYADPATAKIHSKGYDTFIHTEAEETASLKPPPPQAHSSTPILKPPGHGKEIGEEDAVVPLLSLSRQGRTSANTVRLYDTMDDGRAVSLTSPLGPHTGIPSTSFLPAPPPIPPAILAPPGRLPNVFGSTPLPMPGFSSGIPPPPQTSYIMTSTQQLQSTTAAPPPPPHLHSGHEDIIYLKMPPPPRHFKRSVEAQGGLPPPPPRGGGAAKPTADEEGSVFDSPRSEGRVIIGMEEALRAEERLKRKASKRLAKNASKQEDREGDASGGGGRKEKEKEDSKKRSKKGSREEKEKVSKTFGSNHDGNEASATAQPKPSVSTITMRLDGMRRGGGQGDEPLAPAERAEFRRYVDDLLTRNPPIDTRAPIDTPDLPPGFSLVTPTLKQSTAAKINEGASSSSEQDPFLQRLLTQQQAMFELHQEVLTKNQQENTKLLRDLLIEKSKETSSHRPEGGLASSTFPLSHAGLGLSPTQQSQLLNQAMDQRDRLVRMNDDILRLQTQNAALATRSPPPPPLHYINNGPQVVYVPVPSSSAGLNVGQAVAAVGAPALTSEREGGGLHPTKREVVDAAAQSTPTKTEAMAVNTSLPHALHAGVQAYIASPEKEVHLAEMATSTIGLPVSTGTTCGTASPSSQQPLHYSERTAAASDALRATMMQMDLLSEQLAAATQQSEETARVMSDTQLALERSRQLRDLGVSTAEQSAAIEALRVKAGMLQSQLSYVSQLPRDSSPQVHSSLTTASPTHHVGCNALPPYATDNNFTYSDWDAAATPAADTSAGATNAKSGAFVPSVNPLRQSLLLTSVLHNEPPFIREPSAANHLFSSDRGAAPTLALPASASATQSPATGSGAGVATSPSRTRYPEASTPYRSIMKESSAVSPRSVVPPSDTGIGQAASASKWVTFDSIMVEKDDDTRTHEEAAQKEGAVSPAPLPRHNSRGLSFSPTQLRRSVTIEQPPEEVSRTGRRDAPMVQGNWEVLGTAASVAQTPMSEGTPHASAECMHFHPTPSTGNASGIANISINHTNRNKVISLGELIEDAKVSAKRDHRNNVVATSSHTKSIANRKATATQQHSAPSKRASSSSHSLSTTAQQRFSMYLQPALRNKTRSASGGSGGALASHHELRGSTTATEMKLKNESSLGEGGPTNDSEKRQFESTTWELRSQRRFLQPDDTIAMKQKSLLIDHTAQRIKGLQSLLT